MDMVMGFARRFNQTIILVTHDPGMSRYADRIVTLVDGIITEMKGKDSEDGITGRLKRAAAVMISTAMIIGMCGKCFGRGDRQFRGRETIAAEGINEEKRRRNGWRRGLEWNGSRSSREPTRAGANGAGDSTTESAGTETGVAGTSEPGSEPGREMGSGQAVQG